MYLPIRLLLVVAVRALVPARERASVLAVVLVLGCCFLGRVRSFVARWILSIPYHLCSHHYGFFQSMP
ncbi:hypothetical protein [Trueperella bernardiae]|uniref:hypothetical protein n=1 Tax=Trueperella bernardiae TaxID=59561 RepID=UPI000838C8B0|nr:hypothetical protein [Trueperella bernardiae]MCM3908061.1 hypothetical protein [Trueperella bernardiae]OCW59976.1 hypothetical protein AKG36_07295 [Trueperella bernardiae]